MFNMMFRLTLTVFLITSVAFSVVLAETEAEADHHGHEGHEGHEGHDVQHQQEHPEHQHEQPVRNEAGLWLASVVSIFAISLCGIFGVLVIPIMQKVRILNLFPFDIYVLFKSLLKIHELIRQFSNF